jgi:hypothetical protein
VSLFQAHPVSALLRHLATSDTHLLTRLLQQNFPDHVYTAALKPRALTASSTSSKATIYVDVTHRGRSPCGRYNRTRVLTTSLRRSSLPAPIWVASSASGSESVSSCPSLRGPSMSSSTVDTGSTTAPSTPPPPTSGSHPPRPSAPEPPEAPIVPIAREREPGRLGGLRRLFKYGQEPQHQPKPALRPLVLPRRLGLKHSRSSSEPVNHVGALSEPLKKSGASRRISLATVAGWLPLPLPLPILLPIPGLASITAQPYSASNTPPLQDPSSRLKPLKLSSQSTPGDSENSSSDNAKADSKSERANLLAWLLDCIARDIKPHWSVIPWGDVDGDERARKMVLGNGQARCLAVREKRRSALF